jgi:RNA polymerase sigma-70 factor (ECF subfamily)
VDAEDDRQLVARLRLGDAKAAAELIDRNAPRLHAMLTQLCNGDRGLADEFTQEAFARAWERLDRFDGLSSFGTWLYRLARNRAIDLLAKRRPMASDLQPHAAITHTQADAVMIQREQIDAVRSALAALDAEAREIILLRDFDGLDYDAIATVLDCAVGTVKSRLSRARASLRERLAGHIVAEDLA